jgi:hypothetical protein
MVWISAEAMPITAFYGEKEKGQNKSVREVKGADGCPILLFFDTHELSIPLDINSYSTYTNKKSVIYKTFTNVWR